MKNVFARTMPTLNLEAPAPIYVNNCGFHQDIHTVLGVDRPAGQKDHHILCVVRGRVKASYEGRTYFAGKNSVLLFCPQDPQIYAYYPEKDNLYYWIHFSGRAVPQLIASCGLEGKRILSLQSSGPVRHIFDQLIHELQARAPYYESFCNGLLLTLLSSISRGAESGDVEKRFALVLQTMNADYMENRPISFYASQAGLSTYYFIKKFKALTGASPRRYLTLARVENAKTLLLNTDLSIAAVAKACGYTDQLYFSRVFKSATGQPPTAYRG